MHKFFNKSGAVGIGLLIAGSIWSQNLLLLPSPDAPGRITMQAAHEESRTDIQGYADSRRTRSDFLDLSWRPSLFLAAGVRYGGLHEESQPIPLNGGATTRLAFKRRSVAAIYGVVSLPVAAGHHLSYGLGWRAGYVEGAKLPYLTGLTPDFSRFPLNAVQDAPLHPAYTCYVQLGYSEELTPRTTVAVAPHLALEFSRFSLQMGAVYQRDSGGKLALTNDFQSGGRDPNTGQCLGAYYHQTTVHEYRENSALGAFAGVSARLNAHLRLRAEVQSRGGVIAGIALGYVF